MGCSFKFIRENDVFKWESCNVRIEFSNPSIQASYDNSYLDLKNQSLNSIRYFYYDVKIYRKTTTYQDLYDENDNYVDTVETTHWTLVAEVSTYDFPGIFQLQHILETYLNNNHDVVENGEKHLYEHRTEYSTHFWSDGFAANDFYEITKFVCESGGVPHYSCYIGVAIDPQGDNDTYGIRLNFLTNNDMIELFKCVESFIEFGVKKYNEQVLFYNKLNAQSYSINNGKLYQFLIKNDKVFIDKIDNIYCVNDSLSTFSYWVYEDDTHFYEISYSNVFIKEIRNNTILLSNNIEISIEDILYVSSTCDETNTKLYYNIDEISNDFLSILNDDEKNEFKTLSDDYLFNKYSSSIINRTHMCRDEHNFEWLIDENLPNSNILNVYEYVKIAISTIKKILNT